MNAFHVIWYTVFPLISAHPKANISSKCPLLISARPPLPLLFLMVGIQGKAASIATLFFNLLGFDHSRISKGK